MSAVWVLGTMTQYVVHKDVWLTDVRFEQFRTKMDLEQSQMFDQAIRKILVGWSSYFLVLLLTVRENPHYC